MISTHIPDTSSGRGPVADNSPSSRFGVAEAPAAASMEMAYHMSPYVHVLGDSPACGSASSAWGRRASSRCRWSALQMVRAEGALAVVAIDMLPERLELARTLGADQVVRIEPGTPAAELEREPLQASIDCTGAAHGMQVALGPHGRRTGVAVRRDPWRDDLHTRH